MPSRWASALTVGAAALAVAQAVPAQAPPRDDPRALRADPRGLRSDDRGLGGNRRGLRAESRAVAGRARSLAGRGRRLLGEPVAAKRRAFRTVIRFGFDDDVLLARARRDLGGLASRVSGRVVLSVHIGGHADWIGRGSYNLGLSKRRARETCRFLRDEARLQTPACRLTPRGERDPIARNDRPDGSDNPAGRRLNRRAVIVVRTIREAR